MYKADGNGNSQAYDYTVRGEVSHIYYPDGTNEAFDYDDNGDLWHHTKADGGVVTFAYDDDSRLSSTTYPAGSATATVTGDYYANGLPFHMTDGLGTTTWAYDADHRLSTLSSGQESLAYYYDDDGRLTSKVVASVGAWTYGYDPAGRLTGQGTPQGPVTYGYDNADRLSRLTKGNGMLTDYSYDSDGRATEVFWHWNWSPAVMGDYHYRYDPSGDLIERSDPSDGTDVTYGYDGADQLTSESSNGYSYLGVGAYLLGYTYDRNGNRQTKSLTGGSGTLTDTYTYQTNAYNGQTHTDRLLSVSGGITGSKSFTYDPNGVARTETTNGQTLYLTADAADRYTRLDWGTGPGQGTVYSTASYNGAGARFFRLDAQGHAHYPQYDGVSPGAPMLYDSAGGSLYTPGVAQTVNGVTLYTNVDALGSVHDTQTNGDYPRDQRRFEAFGGQVGGSGGDTFALGFAASSSYQTDSDTGLMLLGNRYYDPTIGRFLSEDPSGDGDNWYAYCRNNPLNYVDPTGLDTEYTVTTYQTTTSSASSDGGKTWKVTGVSTTIVDQFTISVPDGQNIDRNVSEARQFRRQLDASFNGFSPSEPYHYLSNHTRHLMIGDYKDYADTASKPYHDPLKYKRILAGNFNYGAMGAALGYSIDTLLAGANLIHIKDTPFLELLRNGPMHPINEQTAIIAGYRSYTNKYGSQ